jgi:hypothetical protein
MAGSKENAWFACAKKKEKKEKKMLGFLEHGINSGFTRRHARLVMIMNSIKWFF